ncbi:MAG: hypothetical protein PHN60_04620 [Candidatus Gracilibacteria bacterium]|nr:hypothetical protein [Candidatus Gracilibacteria bacterium]
MEYFIHRNFTFYKKINFMEENYIPMSENSRLYIQRQLAQMRMEGEKVLDAIVAGKRDVALQLTRNMDNILNHVRSTVANNMTEKDMKK